MTGNAHSVGELQHKQFGWRGEDWGHTLLSKFSVISHDLNCIFKCFVLTPRQQGMPMALWSYNTNNLAEGERTGVIHCSVSFWSFPMI